MHAASRRFRQNSLYLLLAGTFAGTPVHAGETILDTVVVSAERNHETPLASPVSESPSTLYQVEPGKMRLFDTPGGTNPYTAVAELPGVKSTPLDAYGLNNSQGGQKGLRVRGELSTHGATGTVEGVSLGGPGPGPSYLFLFDKENIRGITLSQGPNSGDRNSLFNTYGALDTRLRWPEKMAGGEIGFAAGESGFLRGFMRADSGLLASGTALFVSASQTHADKWRGSGDAPGARENVELGLSQNLGDLHINLIFAHNDQNQHNYRGLTYTQASKLGQYRNYDYSSNRNSSDYYDYNRQDFRNEALLAEIAYTLTPDTSLTIKPYYATEKGYYLFAGSTSTQVTKWLIDHETYGLNGELKTRINGIELRLGHAWTSTEPPGPPTNQKSYTISNGKLVFQKWALLSEMTDRHEFHNTYLSARKEIDRWNFSGSLRRVSETLPGITAYSTTGIGDLSVDEAVAKAKPDLARSVSARTLERWLPQFGFSYALTPEVELRANAGQNIGSPSLDVFRTQLGGALTSTQQVWNRLSPEISSGIDVGARIRLGQAYIDPTLYYARTRNKGISVYDASTSSVYAQNIGKTEAMGAQLAAGWSVTPSLQLLSALSYSRSVFREDVQTAKNTTLSVKGRQLPDVPLWMGNIGAIWETGGFSVAPLVQYVGPRWGTSNYDERIPGYWLTDLTFGYRQKTAWGRWSATAGVMNLFDRKYIGQISASELTTASNGIYYPGAPRTAFASVNIGF